MEPATDIVAIMDKVLGGPIYTRVDKSITVSSAVVGLCLITFSIGARIKVAFCTLSQAEFVTALAVGASLMCLSAFLRLYSQRLGIEKIAALAKSAGIVKD